MIIGIDGNEANISHRVGSNEYAFELIKNLRSLKSPHKFVVYLNKPPLDDMPAVSNNWSYCFFGPGKFWTQWRLPLQLFLRRPKIDVFLSPGHYAPRWSPVPVVASIMDLGFLKFPNQFTKRIFFQLKFWTGRSIKVSSHILAISNQTKNDIIREYKVPESKVTVTYPGYDEERFKSGISVSDINKVKIKYKIKERYVLYLGTLKPSKNIKGIIESFNLYITQERIKDIQLVIAGKKGWMYNEILSLVGDLNLESRVVFTDFVSEEDIPPLMAGASVFLMPSFWEGFGIPVLEAMASGTPVVASNVGSLPEVVGKAGILVNPNNHNEISLAIKEAIKERDNLKSLGLKQVKKFSWSICAKQTLEVLEKVNLK